MTQETGYRLYAETLWISPYVFSAFVALQEKGIPFDVVEVALTEGEHLQAGYRDTSLTARVPSIEHEGFHLSESSAIAEYLEEVLPAPAYRRLFPQDVRERARARQLMAWLRSDLGAVRAERSTVTMFYPFRLSPLSEAAVRDAQKVIRVAEQMISSASGTLFGSWCLADSELAFMLHRLILNGEDVPARVRAYAERQWQRPSVRSFIEHARPAVVPDTYWAFSGTPRPESA